MSRSPVEWAVMVVLLIVTSGLRVYFEPTIDTWVSLLTGVVTYLVAQSWAAAFIEGAK